jgi:predicted GNAT family N-acyltransferase
MTIEIRAVSWIDNSATLSEIRRRVFIKEQQVPQELEWDGADENAQHWLALLDNEPIGTARMLRDGHIGRMAVLSRARTRGIGSSLLQAAIDCAAQRQLREVYLHAQTHALPFYQRFGFTVEGPEFQDAGIPHRTMRLLLRAPRILGRDSGRFAVNNRAAAALDLARQCKRHLRLLSHTLDHDLYDNDAFAATLSQLARLSRNSEIRLLVVDVKLLVQRGHRVLELCRRLSTTIHLRRADCEPEDIKENFLVADDRGVLCYALREPEKAWADYNNRPLAEDYAAQFDELWHRGIDDPELRLLHI